MDLHTIGGLLEKSKPPLGGVGDKASTTYTFPYAIPLRCLYSKDIKNLFLAGRDISVSHVAFASTRLMATCAVIGQAVGTTAYFCRKYKVRPSKIQPAHIVAVQQQLLKDDCFIPGVRNEDKTDLAKRAQITASSSMPLIFPEGENGYPLDIPRGQIFPVSSGRIDTISLLLESKLRQATELKLRLRKVKNIWDLKSEEDLNVSTAKIPPPPASSPVLHWLLAGGHGNF